MIYYQILISLVGLLAAAYLFTGKRRTFIHVLFSTLPRDILGAYRFLRVNALLWWWEKRGLTVAKVFSRLVAAHPNKVAYITEDKEWTYQQLEEFSNRVARYFRARALSRADSVALVMEGCGEYVGTWLGLSKGGLVTALINTNLRQEVLVHSIRAAECKAVIFGSEFKNAISDIRKKIPNLALYQWSADREVPVLEGATDLNSAIASVESDPCPTDLALGCPRDKLIYIYTSGTTGMPKAAVINNLRYMLISCGVHSMLGLRATDRIYDSLPLYHTAGGVAGAGQALLRGIPVVLRRRFSASKFWPDCVRYECTVAQYIGEICRYLLAVPPSDNDTSHKVRLMFGNGLRPQIWKQFVDRFRVKQIGEFYGATEGNSNLVNIDNRIGAVGFIPLYAGALYPVALLRVDEETGEPIRGRDGLCIRCKPGEPGVFMGKINPRQAVNDFSGYADQTESKKKIIHDVFKKGDRVFNSGDILVMDEYGYFYFKDRTGDTFRWRGENVATAEVEAVISNAIGLKDAAVYGVEVAGNEGKAGMAAVYDPEGTINFADLAEGVKKSLPSYARPLFVRVLSDLPMTGTFKLKKRDLQLEAFDVRKIKDPVYFLDKTGTYTRLTEKLLNDILDGKIRLFDESWDRLSTIMEDEKFGFAIDRGGTFTDVYAKCPGGKVRVMKLLSVDPNNYDDAPREGIRRILEQETGQRMGAEVDASKIGWIRMGTTVATNALLERKGARMALLINEGFKDLLFIGNQARPNIFDLAIVTPTMLYDKVVEVRCRVVPAKVGTCELNSKTWRRVKGTTGEDLFVTDELDEATLQTNLKKLRHEGIESLAVVLAHSYIYPDHEIRVGEIAKAIGFTQVSLSHEVMPMMRIVPRGYTACADAYLTPHIKLYLQSFTSGFKNNLEGVNVLFMQSDGGLTPMNSFIGSRAILSGPAGGVVGYAKTIHQKETMQPIIGFDMGGTSTDVSRYDGSYEHVYESTTAGVTIQAAQLDVNTVAAGGGSMLFFRSGLFEVGPESAGAHPGPSCYKKGGPLAVTDANLVLGRLLPEYFPKIFGPNENQPLDKSTTINAFEKLTSQINEFLTVTRGNAAGRMSVEEVAMGFVKVANETMCRPIRALTQAKGYNTSIHVLACFGGAGGQHACAIARSLGMSTVFVHKYAGILSAYGMALADVVEEAQEPSAEEYEEESFARIFERLRVLGGRVRTNLRKHGFADHQIATECFLHLRYYGTDCALMCSPKQDSKSNFDTVESLGHGDFLATFLKRYQTEFGFTMPGRKILVNDVRVRGTGRSEIPEEAEKPRSAEVPFAEKSTLVYFEGGFQKTQVFRMESLSHGHVVRGPAIIMDSLSTLLVEPDCTATVTSHGDVRIDIGEGVKSKITTELDAIQLSIFSHRFMSTAEQMGRILQRTSISTNIKERLDFSCAVFGPDGGLVSNAPHIPVHLGAMQETVQYQIKAFEGNFERGDVILANHPSAGGSHLPDLTVITPVFHSDLPKPVFFVASRGHHADIGGITPGSMPPHSTSLIQEGATFKSFLLVHKGVFREKEVTEALMAPGKIPGSSGTRNLSDNLSDLKAQIAANQKGTRLVDELIDYYGLDVVQAYMEHIQNNAEFAVRKMLKCVGKSTLEKTGSTRVTATDYMDDGSIINLRLEIDIDKGEAICDFTGTGYEVWGNCNAPRAVTLSAIIYCLRCIVGRDVPLNQGCLKPVKIIIPKGSLLDPSESAAVVGGNVLTSQRVVDVVLAAFNACAASQGCMNNVTLGTEKWGYYETVAGGSGAGPTWHGRSGVHTHMTNTRITDLEILEHRYPVILKRFTLRPGSGGAGAHRGGDGVVREILFRSPMTLSVLTERRSHEPPGLEGGLPGARGRNTLTRADGRKINLGPKTAVDVNPGDAFLLESPGGGGYGPPGGTIATTGKASRAFLERGSVYEYRKAQESV